MNTTSHAILIQEVLKPWTMGTSDNQTIKNLTHEDLETYRNYVVQKKNDEQIQLLIPVIVFVCVVMVFGILGNLLVLYVYKFRFKRSSSRSFILCLAILDFIACMVGMPYHIYDMYHTYTYYDEVSCKCLSYILGVTVIGSSLVLGLISVDRYRKICKPFGKQISDLGTKQLCIAALSLSAVIGVPNIIMYGNSTIELDHDNITGVECYISDNYMDSYEAYIYFGIFFIIFISTTIVLVVLYTLIGIKIKRRANFVSDNGSKKDTTKSSNKSKTFSICGGSDPETTNEILSETSDSGSIKVKNITYKKGDSDKNTQCKLEFENVPSPIFTGVIEQDVGNSGTSQVSNIKTNLTTCNSNTSISKKKINLSKSGSRKKRSFMMRHKRQTMSMSDDDSDMNGECRKDRFRQSLSANSLSKRQQRTVRITGMLFMITLIYILSYLPHLVLLVVGIIDPEIFENMSSLAFLGYNFLLRSYFVNNIANPFVYGFLDPKFRFEVIFLLRSVMKCKYKRVFRK